MGCCHGQGDGGWDLPRGRLAEEVRKKRRHGGAGRKRGRTLGTWCCEARCLVFSSLLGACSEHLLAQLCLALWCHRSHKPTVRVHPL